MWKYLSILILSLIASGAVPAAPRSDGSVLVSNFRDPAAVKAWKVPAVGGNRGDFEVRDGRLTFAAGMGDNNIVRNDLDLSGITDLAVEVTLGVEGDIAPPFSLLTLIAAGGTVNLGAEGDAGDGVVLELSAGPRTADLGYFRKGTAYTVLLQFLAEGDVLCHVGEPGQPLRFLAKLPRDNAAVSSVVLGNGVGRAAGGMFAESLRIGRTVEGPADPAVPSATADLTLQANRTAIVYPPVTDNHAILSAYLLQTWLRRAERTQEGYEVLTEDRFPAGDTRTVLALGRTQFGKDVMTGRMGPAGFVIKRLGRVIVIKGGDSQGTYCGAAEFLDRFCGVRFYMPTDLFTSGPKPQVVVPAGLDFRREPFVRSASMSGVLSVSGDSGWIQRNAGWRRLGGTHQHNMFDLLPPDRYAEKHPEIYPIIKGQRHIPEDKRDQRWQPCLSADTLVDVALDSAERYFEVFPHSAYLSVGVQDDHAVCECERCTPAYEKFKSAATDPKHIRGMGFSELYWQFVDRLARRFQERLPGKLVVALVYGPARFPPTFKMPPNVVLFTNFHIAELDADRILAVDPATGKSKLVNVLEKCAVYGNHDWYHGNGYLIPRIYSGYWSRYMRTLSAHVEGAYAHTECYPNWGLDGPKFYIMNRLWWDPDADVEAILKQFCDDMFGPASAPMQGYFKALEALWIELDNVKGPERKLHRWTTQFITDEQDRARIARCRALLDQAAAQASSDDERKRIALFSRSFRLSEYLFAAAVSLDDAKMAEIRQYVRSEILPDPMTIYRRGLGGKTGEESLLATIEDALKVLQRQHAEAAKE